MHCNGISVDLSRSQANIAELPSFANAVMRQVNSSHMLPGERFCLSIYEEKTFTSFLLKRRISATSAGCAVTMRK
jgi:hypothetical protein